MFENLNRTVSSSLSVRKYSSFYFNYMENYFVTMFYLKQIKSIQYQFCLNKKKTINRKKVLHILNELKF
jgi:hypothetical protein